MAETTETAIWTALKSRCETLPLSFPKAYPKQVYAPVTGQPFLEVLHIPNRNGRPFLGADDPMFRQGILQINLRSPVSRESGSGELYPDDVDVQRAGQIAAHFWADLPARKLFHDGITITIQRAPDVAEAFREGAWWVTPVSVYYEVFK